MNPFLWLLFGLASIIIVLVIRCAYQFGKLLEFADRERDLSLDGRVGRNSGTFEGAIL